MRDARTPAAVDRRDNAVRWGLVALFSFMTYQHVAHPGPFEEMIPDWVPGDTTLVHNAATAAEAASAVLLAVPRTRRLGGMVAFATLAGVWVANIQAAIDGGTPGVPPPFNSREAAIVRVPLQLPLLWAAWRQVVHGRRDREH